MLPPPAPPGVNTTNAGRFSFSDPRPYEIHAPVEGRVASTVPVWKRLRAGVCVGLNVYMERMTQSLSATEASCGSRLLTSTPPLPCFLNSNGEGNKPAV